MTSFIQNAHDDEALAALDQFVEVPARRQPGKLVELFVEGEEPYTVRVANREQIAWEKTAARHKEWPRPTSEDPNGGHFMMTFEVWVVAKREGRTTLTFDQWQEALIDWEIVKEEPADPTQ